MFKQKRSWIECSLILCFGERWYFKRFRSILKLLSVPTSHALRIFKKILRKFSLLKVLIRYWNRDLFIKSSLIIKEEENFVKLFDFLFRKREYSKKLFLYFSFLSFASHFGSFSICSFSPEKCQTKNCKKYLIASYLQTLVFFILKISF